MDVLKRIDRLQASRCSEQARIMKLIAAGAFYDEVAEADKDAYCEYRHYNRQAMEQIEMLVKNTLHFRLEKIPEPEPLEKIQAEIAALMEQA